MNPPTTNHIINLPAYLKRIQLPANPPPPPTLSTLELICAQHNRCIPFENIDVVLSRSIKIDLRSLESKIVLNKRGGYCFEQNTLLQAVLLQVGYSTVRRVLCRVRSGRDETMPATANTHVALIVQDQSLDRKYIVDVAFGGKQSIHPLRLDMNEETQTVSDGLFRTRAVDDGYTLIETKNSNNSNDSNNESSWRSLYKFRDETAESVDCEMGNFWTSNYPTSRFCTQFFISRRVGVENGRDEFHYILNNSYVARRYDGSGVGVDEERIIQSKKELVDLVRNVFDVRFQEEEEGNDLKGIDRYLSVEGV